MNKRNSPTFHTAALAAFAVAAAIAAPAQAQAVKNGQPAPERYAGIIVKYKATAPSKLGATGASTVQAAQDRARVKIAGSRPAAMGLTVYRFEQPLPAAEARAAAARMSLDPNVEYAVPDQIMRRLQVTPNDPDYAMRQWSLKAPAAVVGGANLPAAWQRTTGSNSVVVAVLDTGIRPGHPDLTGRLLPGYDFISGDAYAALGFPANWIAGDGNGRDNDPTDPGDYVDAALLAQLTSVAPADQPAISPSSWHGTHVAGIIGAAGNNNVGIAGVDWTARILPVRVLGRDGGTTSDIVDGMAWAAGLAVPGVPNNSTPARVINLSLGGSGACSAPFQDVIGRVRAAGGIVVVAAGNDGAVTVSQPANCNGVIAVTAHAPDGDNASYANVGAEVTVSAPGGGCGSFALIVKADVQASYNTMCAGCHNNFGGLQNIRDQIRNRTPTGLTRDKTRAAFEAALLGTSLGPNPQDTNMEAINLSTQQKNAFIAWIADETNNTSICSGPSDRVRSTLNTGTTTPGQEGYGDYMGTSMATPHVAGVVALILALEPRLTFDEVKSVLQSTARPHPKGTYCESSRLCGSGLLDADAALAYVIANRPTVSAVVQAGATGVRPSGQFSLVANLKATNGRTAPSSGVTWKQTSGPAATMPSSTGTSISLTAPATTGTLGFSVSVVDSGGYVATSTFTVVVNAPPTLQPVAPVAAKKGDALSGAVRATDSDGDRITYVLVSAPDGLKLDAATGNWTWTPSAPGTYNVTVMPTDPYGNGTPQSFTVTVADKSGGGALPVGLLALLLPALLRRRPAR